MGFSNAISLECVSCDWSPHEFYTSPEIKNACVPGKSMHEVNVRAVMGFREIGCGHQLMKTFAGVMNMPQPMNFKSYNNINSLLLDKEKENEGETYSAGAN